MIENAFRDFPGADLSNSLLIGDSLSDIQSARRMDMRSIFIMGEPDHRKDGYEEAGALANAISLSLAEAIELLPD
jgi:histidinol phosphatase-like enzyme